MANIIVAIACNLIVTIILVSGIVSAINAGAKVSILKFIFTIVSGVGAYFLTPILSDLLLNVVVVEATEQAAEITINHIVINQLELSIGTVNSVIYLLVFMVFYLIGTMICNIVRHISIKKYGFKSENKARLKRAKSINPRAEKAAKIKAWKSMKSEYKSNLTGWGRFTSILLSAISSIIVGFIVLTPYNFIAKDIVEKNESREFLLDGFDYTLNGIIEDNIPFDFDGWLVGAQEEISEEEVAQ